MPVTGNKSFSPLSLSIRMRADGFSFFVCDVQSNTLIRGAHFEASEGMSLADKLRQELGNPEYFNRQIDQAYVLVCTPSTHVPLDVFSRDEARDLLAFTFPETNLMTSRVAYTILPELESVELFALDREVEDAVLQYYPTARIFASRSMLLERLLRFDGDRDVDENSFYCCLTDEGVELAQFADGRLRYANSFVTHEPANIQYYALNAWQMLGLDAEHDHLVIIAESTREHLSALQQGFSLYVRHVEHFEPSELFPNVALARERQMPLDLKALLLNRL